MALITPIESKFIDCVVNGFYYTIGVTHTKKNDNSNTIYTNSYIDNALFGTETKTNFTGSQEEANAVMNLLTERRLEEMQNACAKSPANMNEDYSIGDMYFNITTLFYKKPEEKVVMIKNYLDGLLYNSDETAITAVNLQENLVEAQIKATKLVDAIKRELNACPGNRGIIHPVGGLKFQLDLKYTKSANTHTMNYTLYCDNEEYSTNSVEVDNAYLANSIITLKNRSSNDLELLERYIDETVPRETNFLVLVGDLNFNLGIKYNKNKLDKAAIATILLDGAMYTSTTVPFSLKTIKADSISLEEEALKLRSKLEDFLNQHKVENSYVDISLSDETDHIHYRRKHTFSKIPGSNQVYITTTLDGKVFRKTEVLLNINRLGESLDNIYEVYVRKDQEDVESAIDCAGEGSFLNFIEDYKVNGFTYRVGAVYTKNYDNSAVRIDLMVDGNIVETFVEYVNADNLIDDIRHIKELTEFKIKLIKIDLKGIHDTEEIYKVRDCEFAIRAHYEKDLDRNKITISTTIDHIPVGSSDTYDFVKEDTDKYEQEGLRRIEELKRMCDEIPKDQTLTYSLREDVAFEISVNYKKEKDSPIVTITSKLDGKEIKEPIEVSYHYDNLTNIQQAARNRFIEISEQLDNFPDDLVENYVMIGGFGFYVDDTYFKKPGLDYVVIDIRLDGQINRTTSKTFDMDHMEDLKETAKKLHDSLLEELDSSIPKNEYTIWEFNNLKFLVQKVYIKEPGNKNVRSYLKIDGSQYQYGSSHIQEFDFYHMDKLREHLDSYLEEVKETYRKLAPKDIYATYSKDRYNFGITIKVQKDPGTDIVNIQYTINNLNDDNSFEQDQMTFSTQSTIMNLSDTLDLLKNGNG